MSRPRTFAGSRRPNVWEWKWRFNAWEAVALAAMFVACLLRMFLEKPFFYFQF